MPVVKRGPHGTSLRRVYASIRDHSPRSAEWHACVLGLAASTVRRHIAALLCTGALVLDSGGRWVAIPATSRLPLTAADVLRLAVEPLSTADVAGLLGVRFESARKHLLHLTEGGAARRIPGKPVTWTIRRAA